MTYIEPPHAGYIVTVLPPGNRGRNKRGLCLHKPTRNVKRPKKQATHVLGLSPAFQRNSASDRPPARIYLNPR